MEDRIRRACKHLLLAREDLKSDKPEIQASGRCMLMAVSMLLSEVAEVMAGNGDVAVQSERRLYEFMVIKLNIANENTDSAVVGEVYALLKELCDVNGDMVLGGWRDEKGRISAGEMVPRGTYQRGL
jgi:hypothetical protein